MSHLKIQRKKHSSPGIKLHSEQSREHYAKRSLGKIPHESIARRRIVTHNSSPQHSPQDYEHDFEQARRVYQQKNTKKALPMFRRLHQKNPSSPEIPYYMGSCLLNEGQFEPALNFFRISQQLNPHKDRNIHIYMAICCKALGNYAAAIRILNEATDQNPQFEEAYFYKGKMYFKSKKFPEAIQSFKKCIAINPSNQLAHIQLADALKAANKIHEALTRYERVYNMNGKLVQKALLKKISLLISINNFTDAKKELTRANELKITSTEVRYFQGLIEYNCGSLNEASVLLEICLSESQDMLMASKTLKVLLQIAIKQKDFFGAEHLANRAKKIGIKDQENRILCSLVQGINDLIKKRLQEGNKKLTAAIQDSKAASSQGFHQFVGATALPYLAYCLFMEEKYNQSLTIYEKMGKLSLEDQTVERFNRQICEGVIRHRNKQFEEAEHKFSTAGFILSNRIEPIFLNCINIISKLKNHPQLKESIFVQLENWMRRGEEIYPPNSLFLFYKSLVYLFQGRDSRPVIDTAISKSDEEVSEYFFIQALSYNLAGFTLKGLQSINKAIDLDSTIPEFFKERSKYYYVLERYDDAVEDALKIVLESEDEEAKLLLTFYYYMVGQYHRSLSMLTEIVDTSSGDDKFRDFQIAIQFRVANFEACDVLGDLMLAIIKQEKADPHAVIKIRELILERGYFSEFTTYHLHLLLACYNFYLDLYDECLEHLFGCLEEIQNNFAEEQDLQSLSQPLLAEIKFNIVIANLFKDQQEGKLSDSDSQTVKYIQLFIEQTEDDSFITCMKSILSAFNTPQPQNQKMTIMLPQEGEQISKAFPLKTIKLQNTQLVTKMMMLSPQKLKFNISPEFDDSFLFNFDVDKIDSKLCPPWFNLCGGEMVFTDEIRNESIMISETEKCATPLLILPPERERNLRDRFKLDDAVQRKLEKLMMKKKPSKKVSRLSNPNKSQRELKQQEGGQ